MQQLNYIICIFLLITDLTLGAYHLKAETEDNEFAEFEDFDEDDEIAPKENDSIKINPEVKAVPSASPTFDDDVQIEVHCVLKLFYL